MPAQLYETEIYDRDTHAAFAFVTVPRRSLGGRVAGDAEDAANSLGLERIRELEPIAPTELASLIEAALIYPEETRSQEGFGPSSRFAQYLAFEPIVPAEASPLEGKSLSALVGGSAGGASLAVGFMLGHPLIVVLVPAGIILCGAAT